MNKILKIVFIVSVFLANVSASAQRTTIKFNKDWKFFLGDDSAATVIKYDDSKWRTLNLPHDWSIEGNFSEKHPTTFNQGALPAGVGWYRKTFSIPLSSKNKSVFINFDGVYRNSEVWINGHYLGKRPNGYISFQYELTPYLKFGNNKNVIAVKVDNSQQPNSRWYTGSGIYRNVWLETGQPIRFKEWGTFERLGTFINSTEVNDSSALVSISSKVLNTSSAIQVDCTIFDPSGKQVGWATQSFRKSDNYSDSIYHLKIRIKKPKLWSLKSPQLYKAVIKAFASEYVIDQQEISFGIRYFNFDAQKGFSLNGKPTKILGVCMHHDLGALGAAVNARAIERQLQILKTMGCNAIRTSHNPPAPELLDLCDKMGFIVMDEAFDMWKKGKNKFDYHFDWNEWHKKDLEDQIKRDRNHPSVFMWSIGNEIREQFDSTGTPITNELVQIVKNLDPTRPVTCALTENNPEKNFIYQSHSLDLLGFNYKLYDYSELPKRFPGEKFIATETASALATRGHYDMPSDSNRLWPPDAKSKNYGNPDYTVSAYDNTFAYWGATHEQSWTAVKKNDFIAGTFVWSGFDFLGEPVPYQWPARSSYYGIVDLAGFPKDVYYMYQSEWTSKPVLHLFPHWNWKVGDSVDVWAYYNNADKVELFLNGKPLGAKTKTGDSLHVWWRVNFEPGTIRAVSKKNGKIVLTKEISTAGVPAKIELIADRKVLKANGEDLSFVTVKITDANGNIVPDADNLVNFKVKGEGEIAGVDNGLQTSTELFRSSFRKAYNGLCLLIIKAKENKGNITVTASSKSLKAASIVLKSF
ncbi:MAG TPA: glycoside hydrolase family 2 TIM barrel-domain containing protein [Flavisolibacter sp.]|nr:glycoside hydrolase family 2 TIM barrel-domain containing protein [Flavisolibacter sp.]